MLVISNQMSKYIPKSKCGIRYVVNWGAISLFAQCIQSISKHPIKYCNYCVRTLKQRERFKGLKYNGLKTKDGARTYPKVVSFTCFARRRKKIMKCTSALVTC